jgi:hypothetical protein
VLDQQPGTPVDAPTPHELYQHWWLHDARWYQGVAARFGHDAANEINAEAIKFVATRVAEKVAKQAGSSGVDSEWGEVVDQLAGCARRMWPPEFIEFECVASGPGEFVVTTTRNFALSMLRRAGSLQHYRCPCLQMREGWFEGLGITAVENRIEQCLCDGASSCRLVGRIAEFSPDDRIVALPLGEGPDKAEQQ